MITFNGVALESIAPVMIEDIRVSPIQLNPVERPRAIQYGSEFVRMGGGERTVTITFAVLERNNVVRHEHLMNISQWAKNDNEYRIDLPIDQNRCLYGVCTSKPDPSVRQWFESKLRLVFTCISNPFWTSKIEKTENCGTQFFVFGDAPPLMRIERTRTGAGSNQAYSNGIETMTFSTIPAGEMVIDLNKQTAKVGSTDIMQYYQPSGSFIIPRMGVQTITGAGKVKYKERWE